MLTFTNWEKQYTSQQRKTGKPFEELCARVLKQEPEAEKVWLWSNYPFRTGNDNGIDIVVKTWHGDFWAIQCKDYTGIVSKTHVNSFLATSSNGEYTRKIILSTGQSGPQTKRVVNELGAEFYEKSWFDGKDCSVAEFKPIPKALRNHQKEAIAAIEKEFKKADKATVVLACGSGKTLIGSRITKDKRVLFIAPAMTLLNQAYTEYVVDEMSRAGNCVIVCSDKNVGISERLSTGAPVTTDAKELAKYSDSNVFATYHSLEAVVNSELEFDIIIVDEAHRTVTEKLGRELWNIPGKKLFMTATPRIIHETTKSKAQELDFDVISMDDEEWYGRKVYEYTMRQAIQDESLCPYEIIVSVSTDEETAKLVESKALVDINSHNPIHAKDAALYLTLKKLNAEGANRIICYMRTNAACKNAAIIAKKLGLQADSIQGSDNHALRSSKLNRLSEGNYILFADKVLNEGIDIPTLDAVVFSAGKQSPVDIAQCVGRVLRKDPNNAFKIAKVVMPIVISPEQDENDMLEASHYRSIVKIIRQLAESDTAVQDVITEIRTQEGKVRRVTDKNTTPIIIQSSLDIPTLTIDELESKLQLRIARSTNGESNAWWNRAYECAADGSTMSDREWNKKWREWRQNTRKWFRGQDSNRSTPATQAQKDYYIYNIEDYENLLFTTNMSELNRIKITEFCKLNGYLPSSTSEKLEERKIGKTYINARTNKVSWALELEYLYPTMRTFQSFNRIDKITEYFLKNSILPTYNNKLKGSPITEKDKLGSSYSQYKWKYRGEKGSLNKFVVSYIKQQPWWPLVQADWDA